MAYLRWMWIPENFSEIAKTVQACDLEESPAFDAKAILPAPKKNISLAVDVAAMTVDGGVLLYGVAEDDEKRPTILSPIKLVGAADRVGQIVATSIQEVPHVEIREYPDPDNAERGCLVVVVPASPRAPHQVTVGGDMRYYGRGAKGNRILAEGEVARLYERREAWATDRDHLLDAVIDDAPFELELGDGFLHAYVRPVVTDDRTLERVLDRVGGRHEMHKWLLQQTSSTLLAGGYSPALERAPDFDRHGASLWRLSNYSAESRREFAKKPQSVVDLDLGFDGSGRLFCGRATDSRTSDRSRIIIEAVIAGNLDALFATTSGILREAGYRGPVDVGVALTGMRGGVSYAAGQHWGSDPQPYPDFAFRATSRIDIDELRDGPRLVEGLLGRFFEAITGWDGWSPFKEKES